jgi:hypothetical protein
VQAYPSSQREREAKDRQIDVAARLCPSESMREMQTHCPLSEGRANHLISQWERKHRACGRGKKVCLVQQKMDEEAWKDPDLYHVVRDAASTAQQIMRHERRERYEVHKWEHRDGVVANCTTSGLTYVWTNGCAWRGGAGKNRVISRGRSRCWLNLRMS